MLTKEKQIQSILDLGIIAIVRTRSSGELLKVVEAIREGGAKAIELTMTTPGALDIVKEASKEFGDEVIIGAGTVLDPETARACILAGAEFIVGPSLNLEVIKLCNRYGKIVIPGALTPTEIVKAWESGADLVKVFPAATLGPGYIKDIKGPLPQIPLVPTGGVNLENAGDFIKAGAAALGVGGSLVNDKIVAEGNFRLLTERARQFVEVVKKAKVDIN